MGNSFSSNVSSNVLSNVSSNDLFNISSCGLISQDETKIDFEIVKKMVDEHVMKLKKNSEYHSSIINYNDTVVTFFYSIKINNKLFSYQIHFYFVIDDLNVQKMVIVDASFKINHSQCLFFDKREVIFDKY